MDHREIGWGVEWIHLAQEGDRWRAFVNAVMNLCVLAPRIYSNRSIIHSIFIIASKYQFQDYQHSILIFPH
jgi:hypothetical protein